MAMVWLRVRIGARARRVASFGADRASMLGMPATGHGAFPARWFASPITNLLASSAQHGAASLPRIGVASSSTPAMRAARVAGVLDRLGPRRRPPDRAAGLHDASAEAH